MLSICRHVKNHSIIACVPYFTKIAKATRIGYVYLNNTNKLTITMHQDTALNGPNIAGHIVFSRAHTDSHNENYVVTLTFSPH